MDEFNNQNQPQEQDPWNQPEPQAQPEPMQGEPAANSYSYGAPVGQSSAPQDYYYQTAPVQPENKTSGLAVASLCCGIGSLVLFCMSCFVGVTIFLAPIAAIVGLILGIMNNAKKKGSKGMAVAGIICSVVSLVIGIIFIVLMIIGFAAIASDPALQEQYQELMEQFGAM